MTVEIMKEISGGKRRQEELMVHESGYLLEPHDIRTVGDFDILTTMLKVTPWSVLGFCCSKSIPELPIRCRD